MQVLTNEKNEILAYASLGKIAGAIDFDGTVPDGFEDNFQPSFYLLQNDAIVINPNYEEPILELPETQPRSIDKAVAQLLLQSAQQKVTQDKLNAQVLLEIAQLKGGNN